MTTLAERLRKEGLEEGIQQGLLEGIEMALEIKFGEQGLHLLPQMEKISDSARLREFKQIIKTSTTLQDVEKMLYH